MNWIDPHIHFFALQHGHYDWLKPNNPPYWRDKSVIARSVYERDLFKGNHATLGGFVHIEAGFDNGQPWREVVFLEQHCVKPFRSVANIDLRSSTSLSDIDRLKRFRSVVGLRHILDDDAATADGQIEFIECPNPGSNYRGVEADTLGLSLLQNKLNQLDAAIEISLY